MAKIKNELPAYGVKDQSRMDAGGIMVAPKFGVKKKGKKGKLTEKEKLLQLIVKRVKQQMKPTTGPQSRTPKSHTVFADGPINIYRAHPITRCTVLPISWAIPWERQSTDPADDRFRVGNDCYITGARVRFGVNYSGSYRLRMFAYRATHPSNQVTISPADLPTHLRSGHIAERNVRPYTAFVTSWFEQAAVLPYGPVACTNMVKSEEWKNPPIVNGQKVLGPPPPMWVMNSTDGTLFTADLASGSSRPLKTFALNQFQSTGYRAMDDQSVIGVDTVDWWIPIGKKVEFDKEVGFQIKDGPFQILFYYDVPTNAIKDEDAGVLAAAINQLSVQVYYR